MQKIIVSVVIITANDTLWSVLRPDVE